ncbi:hypothetical protein GCM10025883_23260 [Mobilicoccus caccae]|uniref:Uncharacterized protein n=1 Tax=Mobilicoccus caccae TaxID=1859295 RepID=A0ABQ6IS72_9MICO|nr:hypothetical protein GCM10025883_23260 [Mobilicoccus caccae]
MRSARKSGARRLFPYGRLKDATINTPLSDTPILLSRLDLLPRIEDLDINSPLRPRQELRNQFSRSAPVQVGRYPQASAIFQWNLSRSRPYWEWAFRNSIINLYPIHSCHIRNDPGGFSHGSGCGKSRTLNVLRYVPASKFESTRLSPNPVVSPFKLPRPRVRASDLARLPDIFFTANCQQLVVQSTHSSDGHIGGHQDADLVAVGAREVSRKVLYGRDPASPN